MDNKPAHHEMPKIETFTGNMFAVNLCALYSLMVKRISKGYTTSDMSFLMGCTNDVVKRKEECFPGDYTMAYLIRYITALEETGLKGMIFSDLDRKELSDYQLVRTTDYEIIHYEMFEVLQDKTLKLIFRLFEENPEYKKIKHSNSHKTATNETTGILNLLFDGNLFLSPETPLSIYQRCRDISGSFLDPIQVQVALQDMTKKRAYPKLKRIHTKERGCLYEKVFSKT